MAATPLQLPTMLKREKEIRIIALDLDGTLLNSKKELTPGNLNALRKAAALGIEIVPVTGRFFNGMPEVVRSLPFLHYAITINGAQVFDIQNNRTIACAEIPLSEAVEIMTYLDTLPVIYDCYMDNWGWMTRALWEKAGEFTSNEHYFKMIRELRTPVPELKNHITEANKDIQKIQFFTKDMALRQTLLSSLPVRFPNAAISSSLANNIEINNIHANKGEAIGRLAQYIGCDLSQCLAFGDGLNDLSMIQSAGIGVAMANACDEILAAADHVTDDCDHDGVAAGIQLFCL